MKSSVIAADILEAQLWKNFAKLTDLFCYVLWQQQGIYIKPYESDEGLSLLSPEMCRRGIRAVLLSFETLKVDPATYLEFNSMTGLLEEKMSLKCVGAVADDPTSYITDLLFDLNI